MSHADKCSHGENRSKVCAPCGKKIIFGKVDKPSSFLINDHIETLIEKFLLADFDVSNDKFPVSVCKTCRITLLDAEKGIFNRPFQNMPNYKDLVLPRDTRVGKYTCNCYICLRARFKGHQKAIVGRGKKRSLDNTINKSNGLYRSSTTEQLPVSSVETDTSKVSTIKLCNKCFQVIGKGKSHICKNAKENVIQIIEKLPEKNQEQIVTSIIKKKLSLKLMILDN